MHSGQGTCPRIYDTYSRDDNWGTPSTIASILRVLKIGVALTYDTWYKTEKFNLLSKSQQIATHKNGKFKNYYARKNPMNNPLYNPANVSSFSNGLKTVGQAAKGVFTKGNIALAAAGALAGTAAWPIIGTVVGAVVGITISLLWDYGTAKVKQQARDSLANGMKSSTLKPSTYISYSYGYGNLY